VSAMCLSDAGPLACMRAAALGACPTGRQLMRREMCGLTMLGLPPHMNVLL